MTEKWEKILEEAQSRLRKGDFDGAIRRCDEIINSQETAIPRGIRMAAFGIRGDAYQKKGDFDRAISDYGEVIKLDSEKAAAFNNRGDAYQEKGDFDRAISDYDEAIKIGFKLDSEKAATFNNRGNAYQKKGDFDRAISDYDEAIKIDPNLTRAFHNRAITYGRLNAQASEKKFHEESERGLQKVREQSEQETKKLREELRQASEQSEQDAEKLREQLRQVREQFRQVSTPAEIIAKYEDREGKYKKRIGELAGEIKTFARNLQISLISGLIVALLIVAAIFWQQTGDKSLGFTHGFALTSLMLAWLAVNYPASIRLSDMRQEKRKMEICAEDYFRKLTLLLYTLAFDDSERQKIMAITHTHFATRSAAEFLADWNPASDDKSNPLFDAIEKIVRRKDDDSPPKPPETKPSA